MNIYVQKPDGTTQEMPQRRPELAECQELVGGYIEVGYGRDAEGQQVQMIYDEDGLRKNLPPNRFASHLRGVPLVGNVIVIKRRKLWLD